MKPPKRKRVSETCQFETTIATDGNYCYLYPVYEGKFIVPHERFKPHDRVRVEVTKLEKGSHGK